MPPTIIVTKGVTRISSLVSLETNLPHSISSIAIIQTAKGPPAPPSALAAKPTAKVENNTSGGACKANALLTAIAGPATDLAYVPIVTTHPQSPRNAVHEVGIRTPTCCPSVLLIVPLKSAATQPCPLAPIASPP